MSWGRRGPDRHPHNTCAYMHGVPVCTVCRCVCVCTVPFEKKEVCEHFHWERMTSMKNRREFNLNVNGFVYWPRTLYTDKCRTQYANVCIWLRRANERACDSITEPNKLWAVFRQFMYSACARSFFIRCMCVRAIRVADVYTSTRSRMCDVMLLFVLWCSDVRPMDAFICECPLSQCYEWNKYFDWLCVGILLISNIWITGNQIKLFHFYLSVEI